MKQLFAKFVAVLSMALFLPTLAMAACPSDSVQSGNVCVDKYEASVWKINPAHVLVIQRVRNGTVTLANLSAVGAIQVGVSPGDIEANGCPATGAGCVNLYVASLPGVLPSRYMNYFQAIAMARNSWKRLPTNQEWQMAALGTPDGAPCSVDALTVTGAAGCVSDVGAFDMVGNLFEMVSEWALGECPNQGQGNWGSLSDDYTCGVSPISGATTMNGIARGGAYSGLAGGAGAGPFTLATFNLLGTSTNNDNVGLRGVR